MKQETFVGDLINLILAIWLFVSPWLVGFAGSMPPAWVAWLSAIAVAVFAIAALASLAEWEEWINLILGIWLIISPWVARFSTQYDPKLTISLTGLAIAVIAAIEIWLMHRTPPRVTAAR
jgi:hypothetical protein